MLESSIDVIEKTEKSEMIEENLLDASFEEILSGYEIEDETEEESGVEVETEPLCGSCFAPLDVDDEQTIAYCDKCQTTVFVERRVCNSSLDSEL